MYWTQIWLGQDEGDNINNDHVPVANTNNSKSPVAMFGKQCGYM